MTQKHKLFAVVAIPLALGVLVALGLQMRTSSYLRHYDELLRTNIAEQLDVRLMQVTFRQQVQEWKNILLRGSDPADLEQYRTAFLANEAQVAAMLKQLASHEDPAIRDAAVEFGAFHARLAEGYRVALAEFIAGGGEDPYRADRRVRGIDRPATGLLNRIVDRMDQLIAEKNRALAQRVRMERAVAFTLVLLLFAMAAWSLLRIVRRLQQQEERLRRKTQMESVGQISGGVAHHFNNLLMVITGNADLLARHLPPEGRASEYGRAIRDAAQRGAELTRQLLAYASRELLQTSAVDVNALLRGLDPRLQGLLGPGCASS